MSEPVIPEEVEEEIEEMASEDELIGAYINDGSADTEKLSLVESWFPRSEDIEGKTNISQSQARAIALAKNIPVVFHELPDEYSEFIENVVDDYMKLLTSVEGESRKEQMSVLQSLFGGVSDEGDEAKSYMRAAIAASKSDDND